MSGALVGKVWGQDTLSSPQKFVLMALADISQDEGTSWMCIETIAYKVALEPRTVQKALKHLIDLGWVERVVRKNTSSWLIIHEDRIPDKKVPKPVKERSLRDYVTGEPRDTRENRTGEPECTARVNLSAATGEPRSPKTPYETPIETQALKTLPTEEQKTGDGDLFGVKSPAIAEPSLHEYVFEGLRRLSERFPLIPKPQALTAKRKVAITARAREAVAAGMAENERDAWTKMFQAIVASDWLNGQSPARRGHTKPFAAHLNYLIRQDVFVHLLEGRDHDIERYRDTHDDTGRRLSSTDQAAREALKRLRERRGGQCAVA